MIRTQIQLPDPLYREVQRVAREQDWSMAEVMRRGAEAVTRNYPSIKKPVSAGWSMPPPLRSKLLITDAAALAEAIRGDEDTAP